MRRRGPSGDARSAGAERRTRASDAAIVYADDDASVRKSLAELLRLTGADVHECENGQQAIELCRRILPALVILDLDMPVLDGFGAARGLRADPSFAMTRIVAVSGMSDEALRARAAGFDAFLSKPVSIDTLIFELNLGEP